LNSAGESLNGCVVCPVGVFVSGGRLSEEADDDDGGGRKRPVLLLLVRSLPGKELVVPLGRRSELIASN